MTFNSDMAGNERTAVLDMGSDTCKIGLAGERNPIVTFPTMVGEPRHKSASYEFGAKGKPPIVGQDAYACRGALAIKHPIERGIITNWDHFEIILTHAFNEGRLQPSEDLPVMMVEAALNPKANRERLTEIFMEKYNSPALFLLSQPVATLYSCAGTTGLVVDSGYGSTMTVAIYEGHVMPHTAQGLPLGGMDVDFQLWGLLKQEDVRPFSETVRDIKEKMCHVAMDFKDELDKSTSNSAHESYELPDGRLINIDGEERIRCTEIMFQPELCDVGRAGVHEITYYSAMKCDTDIRAQMLANVILSGGNTLFSGFDKRLEKDVTKLVTNSKTCDNLHVSVRRPDAGRNAPYVGASILASLPGFMDSAAVSKQEYEEEGPALIHRKCF